jgi:hypothetical protein
MAAVLIVLASRLKPVLVLGWLGRGSTTPGVCGFEMPGEAFFRNVTLLTEKERARCLSMSIGVINMACPR